MTSRWIGLLVLLACTPHEHPREPQTPCPPGMALVEGGLVGAPAIDRHCVDVTEVVTAAYGACVRNGACTPAIVGDGKDCNLTRADRGDHPINCVDFEQARAYCGWLGKRLPSDDEWRHAARPHPTGAFPWGAAPLDTTRACIRRGHEGTCPAGQLTAGASVDGVLDLVGNVAEWTVVGDGSQLRGGSWREEPPPALAPVSPAAPSAVTGLRCVVAPFTAVDAVDLDSWAPHVPGPVELPRLGAPAPRLAPVRPLANLALLQHASGNPDVKRWWPVGDDFLVGDDGRPDVLGLPDVLERASLPEGLRDFHPVHRLGGDALLMRNGWGSSVHFVAVERASHKIRWQIPFAHHGSTFEQFVAPRTLVAEVYGQQADAIIGFSLADGRELWRIAGGEHGKFTRASRLWTDGERGYVLGDRGLLAFDTVSGAVLWSDVPVDDSCGVATGSGAVVIEGPAGDGHRRLDPATGAELGRIAHTNPHCLWRVGIYDGGLAPAVLEDSRMFAFDAPDRRGLVTVRALDPASGRELWRQGGFGPAVLLADQDAVYVARPGGVLVALDAATGAPQTEISLAGEFDLRLLAGGGPRGPLLFAVGQVSHTWLLGRAEQPSAPEAYTVRGRLFPDGLSKRQVANVRVRVGEKLARSDASGGFSVRGVARGAVEVALGTDKRPGEPGGSTVRFDPVTVVLDGRGDYDVGDVSLYHWYTE